MSLLCGIPAFGLEWELGKRVKEEEARKEAKKVKEEGEKWRSLHTVAGSASEDEGELVASEAVADEESLVASITASAGPAEQEEVRFWNGRRVGATDWPSQKS